MRDPIWPPPKWRALALIGLLLLGWGWFLGVLFTWGDSIRGVAVALVGLVALARLTLGWPAGLVMGLACLTALGQALLLPDSQARRQWLYHSKLGQIRGGRLYLVPEWGWVDRRHQLAELWQPLHPQAPPQTIEHLFFGSWGSYYTLQIQCRPKNERDSCSALQQIGERCEAEEQKLPWYLAAHLSAYNADDLPSVYWTIFRRVHPEVVFGQESPESSEILWRSEGPSLVAQRVRSWRDFQPRSPQLRVLYQKLFEDLERQPLRLDFNIAN